MVQAGISITPAIAAFLLVGHYEAGKPLFFRIKVLQRIGSLTIGKAYNRDKYCVTCCMY